MSDSAIPLMQSEERVLAQALPRVSLARRSWPAILRRQKEHVGMLFLMFFLAGIALLRDDPATRMWLLLGILSYLASRSWDSVVHLSDVLFGQYSLEVCIDSNRNRALFTGLTHLLVVGCKDGCQPCPSVSRDCECEMEIDYVTGHRTVCFGFWGRRARRENIVFRDARGKEHHVAIDYQRGADVICGRESMPMRRQTLTLTMRSTDAELHGDHEALRNLCQRAYDKSMECETDVVDIYFPYESSTQWAPEWKRERSIKFAPQAVDSKGLDYHLARDTFQEVLEDALLWSKGKLRVYILHGHPGVGKSHFVTRLAYTTGLPIYRARLTGLSIGDALLQQLFSANVMQHDAVLVHFDEFQYILESWHSSAVGDSAVQDFPDEPEAKRLKTDHTQVGQLRAAQTRCSITQEGFNEFLQGGSSMQKGIVVLSGSQKLKHAAKDFPALFRRAACVCQVDPLSPCEIVLYVRNFLSDFVTLKDERWKEWLQKFSKMKIRPRQWSIDALQQYLMKSIAEVRKKSMIKQSARGSTKWVACEGCEEQIMQSIVDVEACIRFLDGYAVQY